MSLSLNVRIVELYCYDYVFGLLFVDHFSGSSRFVFNKCSAAINRIARMADSLQEKSPEVRCAYCGSNWWHSEALADGRACDIRRPLRLLRLSGTTIVAL